MDTLLLVDGSNLLFQMFFGMPNRILGCGGKAIHGTMGFVGALLKIIRMTSPTRVAVLFDGEHENERKALNTEYKANRIDYSSVPESENPFSQLPDIYAALDYLKIKHAETVNCETDDWIAGYALTYGREIEIVISSFDSDYFQLLSDKVRVLRYRGKNSTIWTDADLEKKLFVSPAQYADFKALVGDTADNIRGAHGVGPKTAAQLLKEFGSLENLLANAMQIKKDAMRQEIIKNTEQLKTNYQLIKLTRGARLPFSLDELIFPGATYSTSEILKAIGLLP